MWQRPARPSFLQPLGLVLLATALLLGTGPWGALAGKGVPKPVTLEGKLVYKDAHVRDIWTLVQTGTGDVYKLPGQPLDSSGNVIAAANTVTLACTPNPAEPNQCTKISRAEVTKAAAPVRATDVSLNVLVMVVSLTGGRCAARPGANVSQVRTAYTSDLGYMNFLRNCSYGKLVYENVTVVSAPVPCSSYIMRCDEDSVAAAAQDYVYEQYGSDFVNSFDRYSYVLPVGMVDICGWVGLAELPGTQTWFTSDNDGVFNKGTVLQESLHNFGIYHGWRYGIEYMDNSTSMGMGNSCPSAPELWRLGWGTPLGLLNSQTLPSAVYKTFSLPATYLGPSKNMIKIQPDWLGRKYKKNVYLALRVKAGGDQDLESQFDGKLNVHELAKDIDNNFLARGDPRVSILGTINPLNAYDLQTYRLVIKTAGLEDDTLTVKVCRYEGSSVECKESASAKPARRLRHMLRRSA